MRLVGLIGGLVVALGCGGKREDSRLYMKPSVAVMKFENRASFPMRWDLGGGTRDILVDRLMQTGRYHVIERPELPEIMKELEFQQSGYTRPQDRAALGKVKNVQYLIKGTITQFSQTSGASAHARNSSGGLFGSASAATVGIVMYVVDVESGEIVSCESMEQSVGAAEAAVEGTYKDISFGGSAFYRTPLGKAMEKVIDKAVERITTVVANKPWTARVAAIEPDGSVLINGGKDRGVRVGARFSILQAGATVVDPETGDTLGRQADREVGTLTVVDVQDRFSRATVSSTMKVTVGQPCRPAVGAR